MKIKRGDVNLIIKCMFSALDYYNIETEENIDDRHGLGVNEVTSTTDSFEFDSRLGQRLYVFVYAIVNVV